MIKGFKDFLMRGNVVDLAVAFVIGAAFASLVNTFVSAIVTPVINAFPGASSTGWGFSLRGGELEDATFINISTLINAVIVFVLTALAVYLILVVPMNKLAERRARGEAPMHDGKAEDVVVLEEIRDLLATRQN